jgi:dTMP kinase
VITGDLESEVDAPAAVTDQPFAGEYERANVDREKGNERRKDQRIGGVPKKADDRTRKGQHHDEGSDLREGLAAIELVAPADQALAEVSAVVEGPLPVEEAMAVASPITTPIATFRWRLRPIGRSAIGQRGTARHGTSEANQIRAHRRIHVDPAKSGRWFPGRTLGGLAHFDPHDAMIREMSAPLDLPSSRTTRIASPSRPTNAPTASSQQAASSVTTNASTAAPTPRFPALLSGKFVVFDGPDGSGKSTQFRRFAEYCSARGVTVTEVREPGGTHIGEHIRSVLLDPANDSMAMRCEMLLYMASRAQLFEERIVPALARKELVLADRFTSSTLAYQGTAGGLSFHDILAVGKVATGNRWPDLTVIFDVDERTAASRLSPLLDRIEQRGAEFHRRVREGYLQQVREFPDRYCTVDASRSPEAVFAELLGTVEKFFSE